jgi:hypothetical protein
LEPNSDVGDISVGFSSNLFNVSSKAEGWPQGVAPERGGDADLAKNEVNHGWSYSCDVTDGSMAQRNKTRMNCKSW